MAWNLKQISKEVTDLVYDKQAEFSKQKGRKVSLEQTVDRLLKEAYAGEIEQEKNKILSLK